MDYGFFCTYMKVAMAGQLVLHVFLPLVKEPLRSHRFPSSEYRWKSRRQAAWSWFEADSRRRDPEQTQGKTLGGTKKPTYVVSKPSIWHDPPAAYGQLSLDDLMQFTCIQQPQKLYYRRLHTVIGMCFWFSLERIIIVLWRKMCKSSLTLHQRAFTPGT